MANLPSHTALREGETLNAVVRDYFKKRIYLNRDTRISKGSS